MTTQDPNHVIRLKDGREAMIRPVQVSDAAGLLDCERAITRAGDGVVRSIEQLPADWREQAEKLAPWTDGTNNGSHGTLLVCVVGGVLCGSGSIRRMSPMRLRHVAHIALGVHPDFQGVGVGRSLMNAMLDWARSGLGSGISRVDLDVFAVNTRAIRLYESMGFRIEGTRRNFVRFADGSHSDDHVMALLLEDN